MAKQIRIWEAKEIIQRLKPYVGKIYSDNLYDAFKEIDDREDNPLSTALSVKVLVEEKIPLFQELMSPKPSKVIDEWHEIYEDRTLIAFDPLMHPRHSGFILVPQEHDGENIDLKQGCSSIAYPSTNGVYYIYPLHAFLNRTASSADVICES
jgi:hypothetical protein